MKSRLVLIVSALLIASGAVAALVVTQRRGEWTAASPQALTELQLGIDAADKKYNDEAAKHFAKALEHDPECAIARLFVLRLKGKGRDMSAGWAALAKADLNKLSPREAFLISYELMRRRKNFQEALRILEDYANKHPKDPYVLFELGVNAQNQMDWEKAENYLTRLTEFTPNHVDAYNRLGYLLMAQGKFDQAEKTFQTYKYLAPNQANPYDSMGELYTLTGRYDEALKEFEAALAEKPDFQTSYIHLLNLANLRGRFSDVPGIITRARAARAFEESDLIFFECEAKQWNLFFHGLWEETCSFGPDKTCSTVGDKTGFLRARACVQAKGTHQVAELQRYWQMILEKSLSGSYYRRWVEAMTLHLEGLKTLVDGDKQAAATIFSQADTRLAYTNINDGVFKLANRLSWLEALHGAGDQPRYAALLAEIRQVNSSLLERYCELTGMPVNP